VNRSHLLSIASLALLLAPACADSGDAAGGECQEGATQCAGNTFQTCENGQFVTTNQCTGLCDGDLGCIECTPNVPYCSSDNEVLGCDETGTSTGVEQNCGELFCSEGTCRDLCADAVEEQSYIGCDYFAVDLDNAVDVGARPTILGCQPFGFGPPAVARNLEVCIPDDSESSAIAGQCDTDGTCPGEHSCQAETVCVLDAQGSPFAVVIANPQAVDILVTIEIATGENQVISLPAGEVKAIYPSEIGFPDRSIDGTSQAAAAFRLSARAPFVAYQFNPLDNENVFSNDGSLLLPVHALDTRYFALTVPSIGRRPGAKDFNGYVSIVAHTNGTEVTVLPSTGIRPGPTVEGLEAGEPATFTLDAFDVLNLEAVVGGDLTGTFIQSTDKSIGVFAGHEAVSLVYQNKNCCADHIEEMMFPTSTWGTEYAIARSKQRSSEADFVRILAQEDNTTITISGGTCPRLMAGEFCEVELSSDVQISADKPILVGHYLRSVGLVDQFFGVIEPAVGDPSMSLAVPVEQYRSRYSFLIPADYEEQYISVVAPAGSAVNLDGNDISSQLTPFGPGDLAAGRIMVQPGAHNLSCPNKCGVEVYGYSEAVSYMFAAGLDLERIVVE
jgi:hypothetical protein